MAKYWCYTCQEYWKHLDANVDFLLPEMQGPPQETAAPGN